MTIRRTHLVLTLIVILITAACNDDDGGGGSSTPETTPPAPSTTPAPTGSGCLPLPLTESTSVGDSIEVPVGAVGMHDDGSGQWCQESELGVSVIDVNAEIATHGCVSTASITNPDECPFFARAAVDVKPDDIAWNTVSGVSERPLLTYETAAYLSRCPEEGTCTNAIYQLDPGYLSSTNWRYVGSANPVPGTTKVAGTIIHFSVFALAEIPESRDVGGPADLVTIVASDFLPNQRTGVTVSMAIIEVAVADDALAIEPDAVVLFSLDQLELVDIPGVGCSGTNAEILTCLFPLLTEVSIAYDGEIMMIENREAGFSATLQTLAARN